MGFMNPSDKFVLINGIVSNLSVFDGQEEFVQTGVHKAAGALAGAGLAATGLAGAASVAAIAVTDSADHVQFFKCMVGSTAIAGRFSRVEFKNGDAVQVVGQEQDDGSYLAHAVRRPKDKTLWMSPHCIRGNQAHWAHAWKRVPLRILGWSLLYGLGVGFFEIISSEKSTQGALSFLLSLGFIMAIIMGAYTPLREAHYFKGFTRTAEKIFAALGYANPSAVDMEQQTKRYWKLHPNEPFSAAPWVYRYVDER